MKHKNLTMTSKGERQSSNITVKVPLMWKIRKVLFTLGFRTEFERFLELDCEQVLYGPTFENQHLTGKNLDLQQIISPREAGLFRLHHITKTSLKAAFQAWMIGDCQAAQNLCKVARRTSAASRFYTV